VPARVRLLHWKSGEAGGHIDALKSAGYKVEYDERFQPALMRQWRESPPDAFVIDLSRLPSHGREIAIALRQSPRTRNIPIVFCDGAEEKVDRIRSELPDAAYCKLSRLIPTLRKATASRPANPVTPVQMMDRYSARSAAQKLGIKECAAVALIEAPRDVEKVLGELPDGVEFIDGEDWTRIPSVALCFIHDSHSLLIMLSRVRKLAGASKLWILWRKGGSATRGDVTEAAVRRLAASVGLVDYKICSVNKVWSAMLFAQKRF
jgi:CheY-like chemotaxis protein